MKVCFEISEETYKIIGIVAHAWGETIDDFILRKFNEYEQMVGKPDKLETHLGHVRSIVNKNEWRDYIKKHKWKSYKLKDLPKGAYLRIGWRNAPIIDYQHNDPELKENIGKYYYKIDTVQTGTIFNSIDNTKYVFRSSLKMLKKAINNELKKYGYAPMYKVRERKVA